MAVTKTVEPERVNMAIEYGVRLLGENRAQELVSKYDSYNKDGVDIHSLVPCRPIRSVRSLTRYR